MREIFKRNKLRTVGAMDVLEAEPLTIPTERVFAEESYWGRLADERGSPLIVIGSVQLALAPPAIVQRGLRTFYVPTAGRVLDATILTINGRTGRVIRTTRLPRTSAVRCRSVLSGLSLFFELMRQSRTEWFKAIAVRQTPRRHRNPSERIVVPGCLTFFRSSSCPTATSCGR
jgi:hypothetical protein